jgi:hypothetical protein
MAAGDRIAELQYLDFLRMRGFRRSVLCRNHFRLTDEWNPSRIVGCYATTRASEDKDGAFSGADNLRLTTTHPVPIEYMRRLIQSRPISIEVEPEQAHVALELFKGGIIELRPTPGIAAEPGPKPKVSPLARHQASNGELHVTTLWHRALEIEGEEARRMLSLLDGTRDHDALCQAMDCSSERLETELHMLGRLGLLVA